MKKKAIWRKNIEVLIVSIAIFICLFSGVSVMFFIFTTGYGSYLLFAIIGVVVVILIGKMIKSFFTEDWQKWIMCEDDDEPGS